MKAKHKTALNGFTGNLVCHPFSVRYLAGNKVWIHFVVDNQAPDSESEHLQFKDLTTVIDSGDIVWDNVVQSLLTYDNGNLVNVEVLV